MIDRDKQLAGPNKGAKVTTSYIRNLETKDESTGTIYKRGRIYGKESTKREKAKARERLIQG